MRFASDNTGPAAPEILDAMRAANDGHAPAYGADPLTERVAARLRALFEAPEAAVYLVATGTAANALALATLSQPWQTVYCHRNAHLDADECGAPEFYTGGAKLTLLDGAAGRIDPAGLDAVLAGAGARGVHGVQPGPLSLTQATEAGTVYSRDQIAALTGLARAHGLPCHMDGARLANALAATGESPADMSWRAGIDAVGFGGTKNGCPGVEAVILFDPARAREFELRRKRGGHLLSKHRYLAAQMDAYLAADLWLRLAQGANAAAARLAAGLADLPGVEVTTPPEANMVFARWSRARHREALAAGAEYYLWPESQSLNGPDDEPLTARLVCDWSVNEAAITRFLALLAG